jgi:hypothetical protein
MAGRTALSLLLAMAIVIAPVSLSARPCILINAPSEKACDAACCANKTCCETSSKNTSAPSQPLAKAAADQQNIATLLSAVPVAVFNYIAEESFFFSSAEGSAHSPPPLALICIRLI